MNSTLDRSTANSAIPADILADLEAVAAAVAAGNGLDPELVRRVRARAAAATEAVRREHGVSDIGVPAIRALRDGGN